jgi:hypothetical protein
MHISRRGILCYCVRKDAYFSQNLDLLEPHSLIPNGVWTFEGLLRYGEQHKQCPYFTARRMVSVRYPEFVTLLIAPDVFLQRHNILLPLPTRS